MWKSLVLVALFGGCTEVIRVVASSDVRTSQVVADEERETLGRQADSHAMAAAELDYLAASGHLSAVAPIVGTPSYVMSLPADAVAEDMAPAVLP
ncbi:MAG: hypothetical protein AAGK21_04355 [Bacteroidota bacterium]